MATLKTQNICLRLLHFTPSAYGNTPCRGRHRTAVLWFRNPSSLCDTAALTLSAVAEIRVGQRRYRLHFHDTMMALPHILGARGVVHAATNLKT